MEKEFGESGLETYQMHQRILQDRKYNLSDILLKAENFLKEYNFGDKKEKNNNKGAEDQKMQQDKNHTSLKRLNQILYGPPGTGKTYHTIDKALEIIASYDEELDLPSQDDRDSRKKLFDEYRKKGQIEFVTFHQSYGYEEFVEGIKPKIDDGNVVYNVEKGIFKELCLRAQICDYTYEVDSIISDFIKKSITNKTLFQMQKGENFTIKAFEFEEGKIMCEKLSPKEGEKLPDSLKASTLQAILSSNISITAPSDIQKHFKLDTRLPSYYYPIYKTIKEQYLINISMQPYILIIDEINRGNISKIFGELITLIEPSKRIGENEELKVKLPYSQEEFGVPKNLYIIGTMNTADRSVTSLDTALRRRFSFIEMMPNVKKLSNDCEGVDLQVMLDKINTRIEYLCDREKMIGHAFFIKAKTLEDLKSIFQNKIIPLLQEYFYNDYAMIRAVLNDNGMIREKEKTQGLFFNFRDFDIEDKKIYHIASFDDEIWDKLETYAKIYQ